MDDRGFIFTADASLALIVILLVSASITAYIMAPYFQGQEHQHLQALASDALETMEKDGTLTLAAVEYSQNNITGGDQILRNRLNTLIPSDTAYNITMLTSSDAGYSVSRNPNLLVASDTATAVRVISGPEEGYLGRAWYKQEEVPMVDKEINVISTVWNFHNYLTNFAPWKSNGLYNRQYWGVSGSSRPGSPVPIEFSIPEGVTLHNAFFLQGTNNISANNLNRPSFGVEVSINGHPYGNTTPFTMLYPRVNGYGQIDNGLVYNYKGNINVSDLNEGDDNEFYVYFNYQNLLRSNYDYTMPWFSLIANYTTTIQVPEGILSIDETFPDAAGLAKPNDAGGYYGKIYDLTSGDVTNLTTRRVMSWSTFSNTNRNLLDNYDDGVPFVLDNVDGAGEDGSAVSVVKEFTIPDNARIFDGYVNINAYGAVDNALVEVWDGTRWRAVFCSFDFKEIPGATIPTTDYSAGDGYGNTPGIVYIGQYLHTGSNKVRITVWDNVPSNDYDLVGVVDSKLYVSYSTLPIQWETFTFNSYQAGSRETYLFPERSFSIGPDATKVYMFVGVGTTTQHIKVDIRNSTHDWVNIYDDDTVPFMIDLAALDAAGPHRFTTSTSTPDNYNLTEGTGYRVRVNVTAPEAWKSGDGASSPGTWGNPTIFSGTRIAVIYKYLENKWTTEYSSNATAAKELARLKLIEAFEETNTTFNPDLIQTEALFTGNLPNAIPVRLDLWK
ncbi:MAG: hypothetical protein HVN34_04140 [Methanobacteriaceae archaeon]|nr:hypothetical protein [Methanobacteriaceae archaeon]